MAVNDPAPARFIQALLSRYRELNICITPPDYLIRGNSPSKIQRKHQLERHDNGTVFVLTPDGTTSTNSV
jgi:hypothetical protein